MAKTKITGKMALQLLEEVVAERPDYVYPYPNCSYEKDGQPSCLVGQVFARAGLTPDQISIADDLGSIDEESGGDFNARLPLTVTTKAVRILAAAQRAQDGVGLHGERAPRKTWGEALEEARRAAASRG